MTKRTVKPTPATVNPNPEPTPATPTPATPVHQPERTKVRNGTPVLLGTPYTVNNSGLVLPDGTPTNPVTLPTIGTPATVKATEPNRVNLEFELKNLRVKLEESTRMVRKSETNIVKATLLVDKENLSRVADGLQPRTYDTVAYYRHHVKMLPKYQLEVTRYTTRMEEIIKILGTL